MGPSAKQYSTARRLHPAYPSSARACCKFCCCSASKRSEPSTARLLWGPAGKQALCVATSRKVLLAKVVFSKTGVHFDTASDQDICNEALVINICSTKLGRPHKIWPQRQRVELTMALPLLWLPSAAAPTTPHSVSTKAPKAFSGGCRVCPWAKSSSSNVNKSPGAIPGLSAPLAWSIHRLWTKTSLTTPMSFAPAKESRGVGPLDFRQAL